MIQLYYNLKNKIKNVKKKQLFLVKATNAVMKHHDQMQI